MKERKLGNGKKRLKLFIAMLISFSLLLSNGSSIFGIGEETELTPNTGQYLEMRATEIKQNEDGKKELTMELWGHDLMFSGFDVRFSYDNTKIKLLATEEIPEVQYDTNSCFNWESEFDGQLEMLLLKDTAYSKTTEERANLDVIRAYVSFLPENSTSDHIIKVDDPDLDIYQVDTRNIDLLLGKMKFELLTNDEFDEKWFSLETGKETVTKDEETTIVEHSPKTGIQINQSITSAYMMPNTGENAVFRFTNKTASNDAGLKNLVLSTGEKSDDPDLNTYKEYPLTPEFKLEELKYKREILEYIDTIDLTIEPNDAKSKIKIRIPKRDETTGNLVYDSDRNYITL